MNSRVRAVFEKSQKAIALLAACGPAQLKPPIRYLVAAALTLLALGVRLLIAPQETGIPFVTFFPAATLAAIIGGLWPGLFATALGAVLAVYFFMAPFGELKADHQALLAALVFCLDEAVVCLAITAMQGYYRAFITVAESARESSAAEMRARHAAEQANEAKSRFLAAASHDLRQPYQAVRLYHSVLEAKCDDPAVAEVLERMDVAMSAGESLLQSLLDVSTLEAGIVVPQPIDVATHDFFEEVETRHRPAAEAKGLSFRLRIQETRLHIDPVLLGRLLDNLIANAIRYTERGHILVAFRSRHGRPMFLVKDTGIGIAPKHQKAVFEEFFQVGNSARNSDQGVGLGLSVAKKTAALMGLDIKVASRLGKGTLFTIS